MDGERSKSGWQAPPATLETVVPGTTLGARPWGTRSWLLPAIFVVLLVTVMLTEAAIVARVTVVVASLAALSAYFLGPPAIADCQLVAERARPGRRLTPPS